MAKIDGRKRIVKMESKHGSFFIYRVDYTQADGLTKHRFFHRYDGAKKENDINLSLGWKSEIHVVIVHVE